MNILGFNPSHHSSSCLVQNGELKFFLQEERIGPKVKYCAYPFKTFMDIAKNHKINHLSWASPSLYYYASSNNEDPYWAYLLGYFSPPNHNFTIHDFSTDHHKTHAFHAFYNSGFKKCIALIIDGSGSEFFSEEGKGKETESIFECSYPDNFKCLYKNIIPYNNSRELNLARVYETITMHLGWTRNEAGKTMGLAPYGKFNSKIPNLLIKNKGNSKVFYQNENEIRGKEYYNFTFIDEEKNPKLKLQRNPEEWHHDESKITDLEKDLAWKVQNETQKLVGDYVEKAIKETRLKQICCAGGYFLNCVTNYYLIKRFPDIEFYFEPLAHDAGTAIGAAKYIWHSITKDTTIRPLKSLYLGPKYSKEELLKGIKKYVDN